MTSCTFSSKQQKYTVFVCKEVVYKEVGLNCLKESSILDFSDLRKLKGCKCVQSDISVYKMQYTVCYGGYHPIVLYTLRCLINLPPLINF